MRPFLILAIFGFPLKYPFPRDKRSLTARGPVRGSPRRARSFGDFVIVSRPSAVGRDVIADLYALSLGLYLFCADSCNPKINASNRNGRIRPTDAPVSHTRYFRFSPKISLPTGHFLFRARFAARLRSRLEQIFCVLLRLSERSRTIEVRVTTLSAQNLHKIFRSMLRDYVYLIDSMPTFNNLFR